MKNKLIAFGILMGVLLSSTFLFAHEFWLMPSKFRVKPGEIFSLNFFVGEDFNGELWAKRRERTAKFTHFSNQTLNDLTPLALQSDSGAVSLKFNEVGTHLLSFESKNSFIALDAEKFKSYLLEDGIDNIYELRKKNGEMNKNSREFYRRYAKTLIQVGDKMNNTFKKTVGTSLEIIPQKNPYALKVGEQMIIQVLYEGKPLADKLVVTWNKTNITKTRQLKYKTDKKGKIHFPLDQHGVWMVSLVHMVPLMNNTEADYQSLWGDLTFEF